MGFFVLIGLTRLLDNGMSSGYLIRPVIVFGGVDSVLRVSSVNKGAPGTGIDILILGKMAASSNI
jgi:hypothetical protein